MTVSTMRSTPPMPTLEDVALQAAAGKEIQDYLLARGVRTAATLALIANDTDQLEKVLIKPLVDGWKVSDTEIIRISTSEAPIAAAVMQRMWSTCRNAWTAQQAAHATLTTPTLPMSSPTAPAGSGSSGSADEKPPKQLPSGTWSKLLAAYESQQLGGRNRVFPAHELLGAESVLARIWWEHEKTKMYSAIGLGELLQVRTFLPSGEINPLAKKDKGTSNLVISDNRLVQQEDAAWQPRSILAVLDGLSSLRWAFILINIGDEHSVNSFFDWFVRLARSRPNKTDQLCQFWTATSWRLAMDMRTGKSFAESIGPIMRDYDSFTECMSREPIYIKKDPKSKQPTPPGNGSQQIDGGKASGKKGGKKGSRPTPYERYGRNQNYNQYQSDSSWKGSTWNDQSYKRDTWSKEDGSGRAPTVARDSTGPQHRWLLRDPTLASPMTDHPSRDDG